MGMAVGGKGGVSHDINVTPLIDVVLVLLIIFMVLTPLLQKAHNVNLPANPDDIPKEIVQQIPQNQLVLSMEKDKSLALNTESVTLATLPTRVRELLSQKRDKIIFFKCDSSVKYRDAMNVMDIMRGAGAERIGIISEETKKEGEAAPADGSAPAAAPADASAPPPA
ncbi:MAG: biopolymer transporter ExbD [Acidobacteriota bacterium]